jgi:hypothetical protein
MGTKCFYEEKTTIKLRKRSLLYMNIHTHHSKIRAVSPCKATGPMRSIGVGYKKTGGRFFYVKG